MTAIAYFDAPSGISGDMTLGALVDAGVPLDSLASALNAALPALGGYRLEAERVSQHGIGGTRVSVVLDPAAPQPQRSWREIRAVLLGSTLPAPVLQDAMTIFATLAQAEAQIHGTTVEDVHFHEVGAVDSIVDIVGATLGLFFLGIEQVFCSPLSDGRGFTRSQHGIIPIPAPATLAILAAAGAALREAPTDRELVTPTGAAIVAALAEFRQPTMRLNAVGYGFGRRELPWPNALRLWVGETDDAPDTATPAQLTDGIEQDDVILLETNIDDMNPQFYAPLLDQLFAAGALDAWLTPIIMKKGRPAILVGVLTSPIQADALSDLLIRETTTLGVRRTPATRHKAGRSFATVTTPWGAVSVKLKSWRGHVIGATPEYDDCAALAKSSNLPIATIHAHAVRLAADLIETVTPEGG
ncbi:MAG TPA: nickel pincer cofactor biosynthesis protein LarC [Thermomicrobiales bacterium]|jgi:uncharacterized protein (TIGR00299 family) protein